MNIPVHLDLTSTHVSAGGRGPAHPSNHAQNATLFPLSWPLDSYAGRLVLPPAAWSGQPGGKRVAFWA